MSDRKKKFVWREIRVGVFVVTGFVIMTLMIYYVSGGRGIFTPKVTAFTYLPSISGLKVGAPVWLNGIEIGSVETIALDPHMPDTRANRETFARIRSIEADLARYDVSIATHSRTMELLRARLPRIRKQEDREALSEQIRQVELKISGFRRSVDRLRGDLKSSRSNLQSIKLVCRIEKAYEGWFRRDSEVTIGSIGLLGDKYVDISIGRLDEPARRTPQGEIFIEGINEATLREMMVGANELIGSFGEISDRVKSIVTKLDNGEGTIGQLINNTALHDSFVTTVKDLDTTVGRAGQVFTDIHESEGTVGQLIRSKELYQDIRETVADLKGFARTLNRSDGTVNRLVKDPKLYENLREVSTKVNSILARIDAGEGTLGKLSRDDSVYAEARESLMRIHSILQQIDQGQGTMGALLKDRALYDNLNEALGELSKLIYDLRKNPKRYLQLKFELF